MPIETFEQRRIQLEISKLEAETEKLLIETKALKMPFIFRPSALVLVLVGILTLVGSGLLSLRSKTKNKPLLGKF